MADNDNYAGSHQRLRFPTGPLVERPSSPHVRPFYWQHRQTETAVNDADAPQVLEPAE